MLLYSAALTPRLSYITAFIGNELFGAPIYVTTNLLEFESYIGPRINYSPASIGEREFHIANAELLFQKHIATQPVHCFHVNGIKAFYQTAGRDFPFDIFAASFYLLARYEEYLPYEKDKYGRYAHVNSLAFKQSFLHLPLVNTWLAEFKASLERKFPRLPFKSSPFVLLPTYDIDMAYSYLSKGFLRNAGGFLKSLLNFDLPAVIKRARVLTSGHNDPFDCYNWLNALHKASKLEAHYFFLLARKQSGVDKNIPPHAKRLRQLIRDQTAAHQTGIHPSWRSGDHNDELITEKASLEKIAGKKIINSRQHYLRFTLPGTYRQLISAGIEREFSMGYGSINGFRASVASSFYWYDLQNETATNLRIFPFCFMDTNAFYHQKLTAQQALEEMKTLYDSVKKVNGMMITIWHNHLLATDREFTSWREVYERFLREVCLNQDLQD
ncbi:MAG TPA: polysaccharide deacetylase family protein, partial [Chitinophagaceae bacterium]|jgi:hypothetical protein|nr:polysaccharide deacetylase family protein [Chitinophagaceae bacterium]